MDIHTVAVAIGAEVFFPPSCGEKSIELKGLAPIDQAKFGDLTFLTSAEYEKYLSTTGASAVILKGPKVEVAVPQLVHKNPYYAMAKAAQLFYRPSYSQTGISDRAVIDPTASIGRDVRIYPLAVIGKGATIGDRSVVYPHAYVGDYAQVGSDTVIHGNVTVGERCKVGNRVIIHAGSALGPDGFGFAPGDGELAKIPQVGIVVLEDDVEIGGLCSIDRATLGETRIGQGTKLDSHVHIAHNVKIGRNCLFCGVSKVAGSTTIGDWCVFGGDCAIINNIRICDGVRVGAKAGVTKSIDEPGDYMGFPAVPAAQWKRQMVQARRYEGMEKRLKALESAFKENSK
jgi:UDP-3-O-[3-hydroxymyristoyl] glucosamine N-acyltransferase